MEDLESMHQLQTSLDLIFTSTHVLEMTYSCLFLRLIPDSRSGVGATTAVMNVLDGVEQTLLVLVLLEGEVLAETCRVGIYSNLNTGNG